MDVIPVGAAHPELAGGSLIGHGGAAVKVFVALLPLQAERLESQRVVAAPQGRGRWCYWPLKRSAAVTAASAVSAQQELRMNEVVLRPVSITYVGLLKMLEGGQLSCCDEGQWRLHASLQSPGPRDDDGNLLYHVHDAFVFSD